MNVWLFVFLILAVVFVPAALDVGPTVPLAILIVALVIAAPIILVGRLARRARPGSQQPDAKAPGTPPVPAARLEEYQRAGLEVQEQATNYGGVRGRSGDTAFEHYVVSTAEGLRVAVSIHTDAPGEFRAEPETMATGILKLCGLVREFQAGDWRIDSNHYFSGESDEYVKAVCSEPENLQRVRTLRLAGFPRLEKQEGKLTAVGSAAQYLGVTELTNAVDELARFRLPPVAPSAPRLSARQALKRTRAGIVVITVLGCAGYVLTFPQVDGYWAFAWAVSPVALVLVGGMLAAGYFGLRGRSMGARGFIDLLLFAPLALLLFVNILMLLNQYLDFGRPTVYRTRLVSAEFVNPRSSRGGAKHHDRLLRFEPAPGMEKTDFFVATQVFEAAWHARGQPWIISIKRGFLGQPWIQVMRPATPRTNRR